MKKLINLIFLINKYPKKLFLTTIICLIISTLSFSQTQDKKSLESKYSKLQSEIKDAEELLSQTKKKKQNSLNDVKLLNRKISVREEMIKNISQQQKSVEKQMRETQDVIKSMKKDLQDLKDEYAKMIYQAYINDKEYEPLHFLFASESISDAFHEIQYIREYTDFRKQQVAALKEIQDELEKRIAILEDDKNEKDKLLSNEQQQKETLNKEKKQKDATVKTFQGEEKKIAEQIKKKKTDATDLNKKIQNIIAEEIRKEKEKADVLAAAEAAKKKEAEKKAAEKKAAEKKLPEKTTANETVETKAEEATVEKKPAPVKATETKTIAGLTPEMALVSKNFEGNKGRLPWPVEKGTITERFGKHSHPVLKDVIVENNGIDITTISGAAVRSLFEGEVVNVIYNPSFQSGVIIKHGNYYTVYTYLSSVNVKAGTKVTIKQKIGTAYTDIDEEETQVHLEIWKGTILLDPSLWISKQ